MRREKNTWISNFGVPTGIRTPVTGVEAGMKKEEVSLGFGLKISPDGRYALFTTWVGSFSLFDIYEGTRVLGGNFPPRKVLGIACGGGAAFSPDGKYFAVGGERSIVLWDLGKKEEVGSFDIEAVAGIAFSPDGKYLLAVSPGPDRGMFAALPPAIIALYNVQTGRKIKDFDTKHHIYFNVSFLRDGKYAHTTPNFKMGVRRSG